MCGMRTWPKVVKVECIPDQPTVFRVPDKQNSLRCEMSPSPSSLQGFYYIGFKLLIAEFQYDVVIQIQQICWGVSKVSVFDIWIYITIPISFIIGGDKVHDKHIILHRVQAIQPDLKSNLRCCPSSDNAYHQI